MDASDPLRNLRNEFILPKDRINMDGNSLGSLPKATSERVNSLILEEWGQGLITSWSEANWMDAPIRIGAKIAPLIGAAPHEVMVSDSTSINIFKLLSAAVRMQEDRRIILSETGNFPTDLYMMQGLAEFSSERLEYKVVAPEDLVHNINKDVAVVLLTQVHYKSAEIKDMAYLTDLCHKHGVLIIWDLSHSVGSIEVDLNQANADFAVGCGYKFLNGGPGAPAFLYAADKHHDSMQPILTGWMGHRDPFAFDDDYVPHKGMDRFRCGTPGIIGMAALEAGLDLFNKTTIKALRSKALQLSRLFMDLMTQECDDFGFTLFSPIQDRNRGGHVSYTHPQGHGIYQAIKRKGVISDFRMPDVLRFGITPMYLGYEDIYEVVQCIREVMVNQDYMDPAFNKRSKIT